MTGTGIAAIQARMADLATLVSGASGADAASGTSSASSAASVLSALSAASALSASSAGGEDFAAALADAQGASGASTTSSATGDGLASGGTTGEVTGQDLVDAARAYIGVPYVWGGESLAEGGLDCSGLVQRSLADLGITGVPRVARDQAKLGTPVASLADAQPGDLLVFEGGKHIGIYVGDGQMIDAPRPGKTVQQRAVYETPTTIRRILPAEAGSGSVAAAGSGASTSTGTGSAADDVAAQRAVVAALLSGAAA